jgi:hypothetical protein
MDEGLTQSHKSLILRSNGPMAAAAAQVLHTSSFGPEALGTGGAQLRLVAGHKALADAVATALPRTLRRVDARLSC